ncbi:MAG: hypothetical protein ACREP6_06770, partial [Candidatus Binataceae bacterium]
ELYVGAPTALTIWANKVAPSLLDIYLGKTGYNSQQTGAAISVDRPDNLFEPVAGDHGSRGDFAKRSYRHSVQTWMAENRLPLAAASLFLAGATIEMFGKNWRLWG